MKERQQNRESWERETEENRVKENKKNRYTTLILAPPPKRFLKGKRETKTGKQRCCRERETEGNRVKVKERGKSWRRSI